eukprot:gene31286-6434_t
MSTGAERLRQSLEAALSSWDKGMISSVADIISSSDSEKDAQEIIENYLVGEDKAIQVVKQYFASSSCRGTPGMKQYKKGSGTTSQPSTAKSSTPRESNTQAAEQSSKKDDKAVERRADQSVQKGLKVHQKEAVQQRK